MCIRDSSGPEDTQTLLVGHTEPGAMLASSPRVILRPEHGLAVATATLTEDGVKLQALMRGETEGWSVQFSAWRDGERLADWGTAVVSGGRAELTGGPWSGARWPEPGACPPRPGETPRARSACKKQLQELVVCFSC